MDSGGAFAKYSFLTKTVENVNTLTVPSAGGSADVTNRLLYSFVGPDQIYVTDLNTDTVVSQLTLVPGVPNPNTGSTPVTFSAASFRDADGRLYAQDTAGPDAGLYSVDVNAGTVNWVTGISGVAGNGTSISIDNLTDTLYVSGSGTLFQTDWTTGVSTLWGDPPIGCNGATWDRDGNAYVTAGPNTAVLKAGNDPLDPDAWEIIIDDWAPGANSLAFYEVDAPEPADFECRYGIRADGTSVHLGNYAIGCGIDQQVSIVGAVVTCDYVARRKLQEQCDLLRVIAQNTAPGGGNPGGGGPGGGNPGGGGPGGGN